MTHNDWNLGEKAKKGLRKEEFAILVGLVKQNDTEEKVNEYLDELEFLALTAGAKTIKRFVQKLQHPNKRTFVGSGKLEEIKEYIERHEEINIVIFDDDLTGRIATEHNKYSTLLAEPLICPANYLLVQ